jgi:hypothetical protein
MTAHHAAASTDWVSVLISYWWLVLIFGGAALEWIADTFDAGIGAMRRRAKLKHQQRMELKRIELEIEQAKAGTVVPIAAAKKPGPCVHRNVAPVVGADETVKAWLCKTCDQQLPADWAVREEDL